MLKAAQSSSVIYISSIAGGPTTVNSGAIYAATKGEKGGFNTIPCALMPAAADMPVKCPSSNKIYVVSLTGALDQLCRYTACEWAQVSC